MLNSYLQFKLQEMLNWQGSKGGQVGNKIEKIESKMAISQLVELLLEEQRIFDQEAEKQVAPETLNKIKVFLQERWNRIQNTNAAYPNDTTSYANKVCIELAKKMSDLLEENPYKILMPTLEKTYNQLLDIKLSDDLNIPEFIITDSGKDFIDIKEVLLLVQHTGKISYQQEDLTEEEQRRVINHSNETRDYYNLCQNIYNLKTFSLTLGGALFLFAKTLEYSDVEHQGEETNASSEANIAIANFSMILAQLKTDIKEKLYKCHNKLKITFQTIWEEHLGCKRGDTLTCLQINGGHLRNILENNKQWLYSVPLLPSVYLTPSSKNNFKDDELKLTTIYLYIESGEYYYQLLSKNNSLITKPLNSENITKALPSEITKKVEIEDQELKAKIFEAVKQNLPTLGSDKIDFFIKYVPNKPDKLKNKRNIYLYIGNKKFHYIFLNTRNEQIEGELDNLLDESNNEETQRFKETLEQLPEKIVSESECYNEEVKHCILKLIKNKYPSSLPDTTTLNNLLLEEAENELDKFLEKGGNNFKSLSCDDKGNAILLQNCSINPINICQEIFSNLKQSDLSYSNIGDKVIKILAKRLKTSAALKSLNLSRNQIGSEGAKALAEALKANPTLITLDLSLNNLGVEGVKSIVEALKVNPTLTTLKLDGNNIGAEEAEFLVEINGYLERNKDLKVAIDDLKSGTIVLILFKKNFGNIGAKFLAEALKANPTLTTLDLTCNNIGVEGAEFLAKALKTNTTLTTLGLAGNNIGAEGAKFLAEVLKANPTLTTLELTDNNLGAEGTKFLVEALKANPTLTSLRLAGNNIGAEGAKFLAEALKANPTITTLDLRGNNIGAAEAKFLAKALKTNTTLTSLNLNYNNLGVKGVKAIVEALKANTTLTTLELAGNNIGAEGTEFLAEISGYLARNKDLKKAIDVLKSGATILILSEKNFGNIGAEFLAKALKTNTTLTTLDLRGNNIGAEGAKFLAEALQENTTLTSLKLADNNIGDEGAIALAEINGYLARNKDLKDAIDASKSGTLFPNGEKAQTFLFFSTEKEEDSQDKKQNMFDNS